MAQDLTLRGKSIARDAENSTWVRAAARIGLVAKAVSYGIVGVLAIKLALGDGGKATSRSGALKTLAGSTFGKALLIGLAIGFAAYALWRLVQAVFEAAEDDGAKKWAKRAGYVGRAAIYGGLTYTTVKIISGSGGGGSQNEKAQKATAHVLSWPGGTWIVGIAGAIIVGVGLYNGYRGVARKFRKKWDEGRMSHVERTWGTRAGVVGLLARLVVFGLIGVFVIKAAIDYNPNDAIGLDGALQKLAGQTYGEWLLGLTAAGLFAYGVYCLVDARYRKV
jgi:Domain of Unknown Function (DUF1206)